jgi:hypothetical protein
LIKAGRVFIEKATSVLLEKDNIVIEKANTFKEKTSSIVSKIKTNTMQEYKESSKSFIRMIIKWKLHFAIISVAAIIIAAVFSSPLFIKPKYKSFAIVYPANLKPYSTESETEQMLQLFRSADVRNAVIKKYNLATHYNIDTTYKVGLASLIGTYENNVEINRTQFESIEIDVLDIDPVMASNMVGEIINAMNFKARNLQREKSKEVEVVIKNQLDLKKHNIDSLKAGLDELRVRYQIFDYQVQAKEVTKSYLKALNNGGKNMKDIDVMMRNLEEKGGQYYEMKKTLDVLLKSYGLTQLEYDNVLEDLNKELTYANVVTESTPSYNKAYPIRWLIVLMSVASCNLLFFLILVVLDSRKK